MNIEEHDAFVLRKVRYAEDDLIVTLLLSNGTKISAFAPSASKSTKRFLGLDILNHIRVTLKPSKKSNLPILSSSDLIRSMEMIRLNIQSFAFSCYILEIIAEFIQDEQNLPEAYLFLKSTFETLEESSDWQDGIIPQIEHRFLDVFGFRPHLDSCLECQEIIKPDNHYFFDGAKGGIFCLNCRKSLSGNHIEKENPLTLKFETIDQLLQGSKNNLMKPLRCPHLEVVQARKVLEHFIQYTAGKPFKSLHFLNGLL